VRRTRALLASSARDSSPVTSGSPSPRTPEDLAAAFLVRQADGEAPDLDAWCARLGDESSRAAFRQLVADASRAQLAMPLRVGPGTLLAGRYALRRELGAGGTGRVYEADDRQLGARVALKVLADFSPLDLGPQTAYVREAAALAALARPDIAAVRAFGSEGTLRFLVEDLVEGRSLAERLSAREARLPDAEAGAWWRTAAGIARDVASAVQAAHALGILHRGLKPENIMLRADGRAVVLDFGLRAAHDRADGAFVRGLFGNVASLPPELARPGAGGPDPRQDVYQLGLVLYELLTGRRPFAQGGHATLVERISLGDLPRPRALDARVPAALEAVCLRALEVDPQRRQPSMTALREDLHRFLGGGAGLARLRGWFRGRPGRSGGSDTPGSR